MLTLVREDESMSAAICSIDGCARDVRARGWCGMHYQRWQAHSDPLMKTERVRGACAVEGCGSPHKVGGHCQKHYERVRATGTTADPPPVASRFDPHYGTSRKTCRRCGEVKERTEFGNNKSKYDGLTQFCRPCHNTWQMERRHQNKEAFAVRENIRRLARHGLTVGMFDAMWARQGSACAICHSTETTGRGAFHIDHDHSTGAVRGILCQHCNLMLGHATDDPERLEAAARYLRAALLERTGT